MDIKLMGWSSSGLRCPDHEINLSSGSKPTQISLIQMPNGTGKTTTLTMLNATLCGEAADWGAEEVKLFQRPGEDNPQGAFVVHLRIDDKPLTFELILDFETGTSQYRTTTPGSGGVVRGWHPPHDLKRFLAKEFIRLFIFDGEFAEDLLDPQKAEADRSIDALCQLYLLDEVQQIISSFWHEETKDKTSKSQTGLSKWKKIEFALLEQQKKVIKANKEAIKKIEVIEKNIEALDKKISTHISEIHGLNEMHSGALSKQKLADAIVQDKVFELMSQIRKPHSLHERFGEWLIQLKDSLDRLKLPENSSKQFFIELSEENICICGRPIDENIKQVIIEKSKDYLGEEASGVLNFLKQDISSYIKSDQPEEGPLLLKNIMNDLTVAVKEEKIAGQEVKSIEQQMIEQGDVELEGWKQQKVDFENELNELKNLRDDIGGPPKVEDVDNEKTICLQSLKKQLSNTQKKVAEISGTIELRDQTDKITSIIKKTRKYSRENIREALIRECNDRLKDILAEDILQLEGIDKSLCLSGQRGASVGQTLAVGYTFLTSVLNRGKHNFPLVVDSPANPLDGPKRRKVGNLVPKLCGQFVGFVIDEEKSNFVESLEKSVIHLGGTIKFITMFRITPFTEDMLNNLPDSGVIKTKNAVIVDGREYFYNFDIVEEKE